MSLRMSHYEVNKAASEAVMALEQYVKQSGLDDTLYELIQLRASQLNGCSFCIDMHGKELQGKGESLERILLLSVWRDTDIYTAKEKAVLALTEHLTRISQDGVPDQLYEQVRTHFNEKQYIDLIMAINTINCWNRLGIATGMSPGCFI